MSLLNLCDTLVTLPYRHLYRCPNMRLRISASRPNPMLIFAVAVVSIYLILAGIVYDIIIEPPSVGSTQDPTTKAVGPVSVMKYRINGQYIIEGLSAGFFYILGGAAFIMMEKGTPIWLSSGLVAFLFASSFTLVFFRLKIPGYLH
ncbi:putative Oligosaccharyl transferase complex; subunit OST3/OST6 [Paratrimastix pyriformis]|uniref:Oligosaccharyl transferase complex n=1 Tax=Paratrimastix pyriformis TaxID=342808 RepID=A0ABQ8UNB0_9EUKA|nr:putative Oligosaccharyl transferase complex; subunit OST3/OST6 [Paratrimastix pyriformis]